ncbi:Phototropic-responsive NPH3 family protein isoform 2 [Hibiscus syriacus]|uniref:Phototropic-responsive NPH3 family protein isoform 2 n=1 Tax=Hibiscus syriacus TaxID=106335 RepID=A0A6A2YSU4_HIBSY|nr:Phototropic-responsive NPH3 family protein isoform 2 [Hibiscus syriacus]
MSKSNRLQKLVKRTLMKLIWLVFLVDQKHLNLCKILLCWKDSIIVLQTTKSLLLWSENLKIVGRCIDSIASKTSVDPADVSWSYTYNRKLSAPEKVVEGGMKYREKIESVPKDWWVEDICELDIILYKPVMTAVKSKGRMDGAIIGEALKTMLSDHRWLPDSVDVLVSDVHSWRNKLLVETIVCLLPLDKGVGCSCSFLLKLLKVAILVGVDDSAKEDLVERYMMHEKFSRDLDLEKSDVGCTDFILGHGTLLSVGKMIDGYLEEIARDPTLSLASFIDLSQSIPEFARPFMMDCIKPLTCTSRSIFLLPEMARWDVGVRHQYCTNVVWFLVTLVIMSAGAHGLDEGRKKGTVWSAQNDRLPLRVVVQVLYFEQMKIKEDGSKPVKKNSKNNKSGMQLLPSRSRRIFDKLWVVGKGHGENKSSETSGSSQSPASMIPGDTKSSGSSAKHRRHSIS